MNTGKLKCFFGALAGAIGISLGVAGFTWLFNRWADWCIAQHKSVLFMMTPGLSIAFVGLFVLLYAACRAHHEVTNDR